MSPHSSSELSKTTGNAPDTSSNSSPTHAGSNRPRKKAEKPSHLPSKKIRSEANMAARRQASARYREKHLEEEREKARERLENVSHSRMISLQFLVPAHGRQAPDPGFILNRHADTLAHRARVKRMEDYGKKHGHRAWLERQRQLEERRAEAEEKAEYRRREAECRRILGAAYTS
ncbi:hypothetical protein DFH06DRAFT_1330427 [Mycena polygramma]|nr:hypothetical protein DFH06DRAFT_1330427 [Mycena polygramma]